jgi:putative copper resistance protein D
MLEALTLETGPKLLAYIATLVAAGCAATLALAAPSGSWPPGSVLTRVPALAVLAGAIGLAALALRAVAHTAIVAGAPSDVTADLLYLVAIESRWGSGWRWQVLAAAAVTVTAWRVGRKAGVPLLALAVAGWCAATPALGHGSGVLWQRVVHALHLGASGAWIGTVLVLAACVSGVSPSAETTDLQRVVRRFSPYALLAAGAVAGSGLVLAATYLGGVKGVATPYGGWLVAKVAAVAGLGACGLGNWRRSRAGLPPSPGLIRVEAAVALLVLVLTSMLTETEHN